MCWHEERERVTPEISNNAATMSTRGLDGQLCKWEAPRGHRASQRLSLKQHYQHALLLFFFLVFILLRGRRHHRVVVCYCLLLSTIITMCNHNYIISFIIYYYLLSGFFTATTMQKINNKKKNGRRITAAESRLKLKTKVEHCGNAEQCCNTARERRPLGD